MSSSTGSSADILKARELDPEIDMTAIDNFVLGCIKKILRKALDEFAISSHTEHIITSSLEDTPIPHDHPNREFFVKKIISFVQMILATTKLSYVGYEISKDNVCNVTWYIIHTSDWALDHMSERQNIAYGYRWANSALCSTN